jgi:integrase
VPRVQLTARNIGSLPLPSGGSPPIDYYDDAQGAIRWFCVRVSAEGRRTFTVGYRVGRQRRRVRLGQFPTIALAEARRRARAILAEVTRGGDPAGERNKARRADDFQGLVLRFIETKAPNLSPKTLTEYRRMASAYLANTPLGRTPSGTLRRADVRFWLENIAKAAPVMANRVFQLVRASLRFGVREELIGANPCDGLQRPRHEKDRERVLSDTEIRTLWMVLDQQPPPVAAVVRLLLLLGQRCSETLEMRWTDLELDAEVPIWTIPGEFRKGNRLQVVPLAPLPVAIVRALRPLAGEKDQVFAGVSLANAERDWWAAVRREARNNGLKDHFTRHDLRSTCATGCSRLGAAESTVSRILGHAVVAGTVPVTTRYDRFAHLPERVAALRSWADHIAALAASPDVPRRG